MAHTLTIELGDDDYAWLLEEARRRGLAPEEVAAMRLARDAAERERERGFHNAGVASGLFVAPGRAPESRRQPFKTRPVKGVPVSETLIEERR